MIHQWFIFGIVLIFISIILTVFHHLSKLYLHNKYQNAYNINDPSYSKGLRPGCLPGCTAEGTCPQGNFCYDALSDNPSCCAYDFQCESCKGNIQIKSPLQSKKGMPPLSAQLDVYETRRHFGRDLVPDGSRRATNNIGAQQPPDINKLEFERDLEEQEFAKEQQPGESNILRHKGHIISKGPLRPNIIRR